MAGTTELAASWSFNWLTGQIPMGRQAKMWLVVTLD